MLLLQVLDQDPRAMAVRGQLVALVVSAAFLMLVLELVRRRRLDEQYSLAWLFGAVLVVVFSLFRDLQLVLADMLGIFYAPALIFGALIFFLLFVALHLSTVASRLEGRNRTLAQRVALLEHRLDALIGHTQRPAPPLVEEDSVETR